MTHDDANLDVGHVGVLADETVVAARRTVAFYAQDAADFAGLLDMLGIAPNPARGTVRTKKDESRSVCVCGRIKRAEEPLCGQCRRMVPAERVREVVDRIAAATGWKRPVIARRAGITPECLHAALKLSEKPRRTATGNLERLQALAAEVGA